MESTTYYLQSGIFLISVANLIVIVLLVLVFFAAITFRLDRDQSSTIIEDSSDRPGTAPSRATDG